MNRPGQQKIKSCNSDSESSQNDISTINISHWTHTLAPKIFNLLGNPPLTVILPDGFKYSSPTRRSIGTIKIKTTNTIYQILSRADVGFGEEYSRGNIDIDGDMVEMIIETWRSIISKDKNIVVRLNKLISRMPKNTFAKSRQNVHHHYDIGNSFYQLWLDPELQYTCAYYPQADMTLAQAQQAKLEHVCRKLQLKPGDHVVEAGCGWGGLARYMALHYDVKVSAYNISNEQIDYARERAEREGCSDRVEYIKDDFRNIDGSFDAFVSVGMLEHVGPSSYPQMGELIHRVLKPHGRGLIHTIGRNRPRLMNRWIDKHIFPGAYPPTIKEIMDILESGNLSVLDIENMRLHYYQTLVHWHQNYEQNIDTVRAMFDDEFIRTWHLYMSGSIAAFKFGALQLFQVVFAHGADNTIPLNRRHIYPT